MPQLEIVCATWNTENKSPANPEIIKFYEALWKKRNQNAPDFVVIGLQETVPDKETDEWVADMCLRMAGSGMKPIMDGGKAVVGPSIMGKTKLTEPFCYQHIGIMQRSDSPWRVLRIKQETNPKGLGSEKGAVALVVDISSSTTSSSSSSSSSSHECIRLVFVSTHLSPKEEEKDLTWHCSWLNRKLASEELANIHFIMGDLNFRLIPPKTKVGGLPDENHDAKAWADVLLDSAKRGMLFQHYDGFKRDAENTILAQWRFPLPKENYDSPPTQHPLCFPTYKRDRGDQAATYVAAIKGKGAGDPGAIDAIKHLFLEHSNGKGGYKPLWNKDRQAWDMGWLDRIGYVISNPSNSKKITYGAVSCWDCFEMVQSDHTPVFLQLKVDVT